MTPASGQADPSSRLITCIMPRGAGKPLVEALHNYGLTTANMYFSRGSDVGDPLDTSGIPVQTQKEIVTVIVAKKDVETVFDFILANTQLDKPGGGFVYVTELRKSVPFVLPDIADPTRVELTPEPGMSIPTDSGSRIITCVLSKGAGKPLVEALHQRGLTTANLCYARGSNVGSPIDRKGIPVAEEKEMVTVLVSKKEAEEIFEFIIESAQIDQPGSGFVYVAELRKSVPFVLPDLSAQTKTS